VAVLKSLKSFSKRRFRLLVWFGLVWFGLSKTNIQKRFRNALLKPRSVEGANEDHPHQKQLEQRAICDAEERG